MTVPRKQDFVQLNIGVKEFVTLKTTLCKLNYFDALINNFGSKIPQFLDRNGKVFKKILLSLTTIFIRLNSNYYHVESMKSSFSSILRSKKTFLL